MIIVCTCYLATWYNHCKELFLVWPLPLDLFPFFKKKKKTLRLPDPIYMHITEGNRGCWSGPKNKDGYWAWWSYHEMCTWSKWKSCHPEMYWMCPRRFYPVYNINILWSCCSIINPPLWLQSHTGIPLGSAHLHASVLSLVLLRFTVFFSAESTWALCWSKNTASSYGWDIAICMHVGAGSIWKLCCPGSVLLLNFLNWHF